MNGLIRQGFGFNTDIFETNILNLAVVLGIVVVFVGDALSTLLSHRRKIVLATMQEADQKARKVQQQLEEAKKSVEVARQRAQEIVSKQLELLNKKSLPCKNNWKKICVNFARRELKECKLSVNE